MKSYLEWLFAYKGIERESRNMDDFKYLIDNFNYFKSIHTVIADVDLEYYRGIADDYVWGF